MTPTDRTITILDKTIAAVALAASSPVLAAAAIGIKVTSPGPILYRSQRAGVGGVPFTMLKLRTMHTGSEAASRITTSADARVFPFGQVLRRLKVDELPQLVNVLRGEMALVGPRPEDVTIVEEYYDNEMWESLQVRPGITCVGSLNYYADEPNLPAGYVDAEDVYLEMLLPRKIAMDLVYVRNRSVRYTVELLVRTILSVLGRHGSFATRRRWEQDAVHRYMSGKKRN